MDSRLSVPIVLSVLLLFAADAGFNGVLGFSSTSRTPLRVPTVLPVATIDAAELFDGSFSEGKYNSNGLLERVSCAEASLSVIGSEAGTTSHAASANLAIERISSSSLAWAAIGAFLSISAALKAHAIGSSLSLFSTFTSWYLTRLEVAPLLTKCVTGGIIAFIGDYGAQWFEYISLKSKRTANKAVASPADPAFSLRAGSSSSSKRSRRKTSLSIHGTYDFRRGVARFLECLLISSPLMHYGYDLFETIMPVVGGAGLYRSFAALSHVFADSVFLDGIFVFTGILATGLLEGHSLRKHVLPNLRNVYFPTLKASVMTSGALMPLQFLSFRFLPIQLRVLSVNAVDLIWTAVVSFVSHSGGDNMEGSHA